MTAFFRNLKAWLFSLYPSWSDLHEIGSSKAVNSSFIWLVVLPPAARVVSWAEAYAKTRGWPAFEISIPNRLLLFYWAAALFGIAAALYHIFCPKLIKKAPDYGAFVRSQFSEFDLRKWFHLLASRFGKGVNPKLLIQFWKEQGKEELTQEQYAENLLGKAGDKLLGRYWAVKIADTDLPKVYHFANERANETMPLLRGLVSIFYIAGFVVLAVLIIQNFAAMLDYFVAHVRPD